MRDSQRRQALRPLVDRLAQLLASADGARVAALLQEIELFWGAMRIQDDDRADPDDERAGTESQPVASASPPSPAPSSPQRRRIGIWTETEPGSLVRERYSEAWHRFADVEVIPPKGRRKRVVWLGESVARAYLYDPALTFAQVVNTYLAQFMDDIEVVDLASTGANAAALVGMLDSCDVLRPDALVIFAGNNWVLDPMPPLFRRRFLNIWLDEGAAAAQKLFLDELLPERVDETLDACIDAARRQGVPLIFVLPEFNLADFRDHAETMTPALDVGDAAAWVRLRDSAEAALAQGAVAACEEYAREMLQLDHGLHPTAHYLLARCAQAAGESERAHRLLARARDAQCGLPVDFTPRCPTRIHECVRERSEDGDFVLVDLPRLFSRHGQVPGRELFLDYCHLSLQGIRRVAQSVAAQLIPCLGGREIQHDDIDTEAVTIAPIHEATAHFLAGVHNAHSGAAEDLVSYRFDQALRICPRVGQLMGDFLDFRNRRKPDWMCASFDAACQSPVIRRYLSSRPLAWQDTIGDLPLFRALERALDSHGLEATATTEAIRREQADNLPMRVDVLECHHAPVLRMTLRQGAFLPCHHRQSRFYLNMRDAARVVLRITWRVMAGEPSEPATVQFNRVQVAAEKVESRWSSARIEIDDTLVKAGTNDIIICWPLGDGRAAEVERLELDGGRGTPPRMFHVFGEIQRLSADVSG